MVYSVVARRLLISCPSDVPASDLHVVQQTINRWNGVYGERFGAVIVPISWGTHAAAEFGDAPQELLNRQLVDQCDACLALFANRLGTPTKSAESGTAEEIERIRESGRYVGILRSRREVDASRLDHDQAKKLEQYLDKISVKGLILDYTNDADLSQRVDRILVAAVAHDQGRAELQLQQATARPSMRVAEVWPRLDSKERTINFSGNRSLTMREWYIVLHNTGDVPARDVKVSFKSVSEDDSPWEIWSGTSGQEPNIDVIGPHDELRFQLLLVEESAVQMNCVVSWSDERGRQENLATLRRL
jgi:hypothetical protein